MDDTISRQAAINIVRNRVKKFTTACVLAVTEIEQLPPAQPQQKKGKWIRNDNGTYSCSVCQSWIPKEQHCYARYCLYCGADMRDQK